jgi:hypothetical protein
MIAQIIKRYSIPRKNHKELRRLYAECNKISFLTRFFHGTGGMNILNNLITEQSRLEKQIQDVWGNDFIEVDEISKIQIIAKGKTITTRDGHILVAVCEQLQKAQKSKTNPAEKPQSLSNNLAICYGNFAAFLMREKLILYKGEPSKNAIAKIIRDILNEVHGLNISEQQTARTLSNFLKITP